MKKDLSFENTMEKKLAGENRFLEPNIGIRTYRNSIEIT